MTEHHPTLFSVSLALLRGERKSVPIQLTQCWLSTLAISNDKILIYFSSEICGRKIFIKQLSETVMHV